MKLRRCLAILLTIAMTFTSLYSQVYANGGMPEVESNTSVQDSVCNDYTLESTNSFGDLLLKELDSTIEEQEENNGYNIFSIEISGTTATVSYETEEDCTLVVGIYGEDGVKLIASGNVVVSAEESVADVTIETDEMPEYFYLKGYLVDTENYRPLCTAYESPNYTQEMQEFFAKTVDDFDPDRVLNLDDDNTNNFAVYQDGVLILNGEGESNQIHIVDEESLTYVVEQAGEEVLGLQPGDVLSYTTEDGEIEIIEVEELTVDGSTVTITGTDTSMDKVFDYVKIDTNSDISNATYNPEGKDDSLEYLGRGSAYNTDVIDSQNEFVNATSTDEGTDSILDHFKFTETVEGGLDINISNGVKLYYTGLATRYVEFSIKVELQINITVKEKLSFTVPLGEYGFIPIPGVIVKITPEFVVEASVSITLSGTLSASVVLKAIKPLFGKMRIERVSEKPQFDTELKVEGKIYIGVKLKPEVNIISKRLIKIELDSQVGCEVKVTLNTDNLNNDKQYHECSECYNGEVYGKTDIKCEMELFSQEWLKLNYTLIDFKIRLFKFHYSVDRNEFSFSECPHVTYQVNVIVLESDGEDKKLVQGATINDNYKTKDNGMVTLWLSKGSHMITVTKDGYISQTKKVVADEDGTGTYFILEKDGSGTEPSESDGVDNVQAVSLGRDHSAAITEDGSLYTWGYNGFGQLGNGTTENSSTPIKIMDNVQAVSLGGDHSAAITENGSLYTWGELVGTTEDSSTPIKIMDNVQAVSLGTYHSAAITEDGSLYAWGYNYYGRLGNGTTEDSSTPIKIMDNVQAVSLGGDHSAAITENGSLYTWGCNNHGQLGNGTTEDSSTPIKIMDNVKEVSLGRRFSVAITEDGSLYAWGYNYYGQLGNGTTEDSSTPIKIMDNVQAVCLGDYHVAVITEDGSLYTWGYNGFGQLGNGTTENCGTPTKIMDNVKVVSLGGWYSAVITEDGSLYTWGYNYFGELGNGTKENSSAPIKIMDNVFTSMDSAVSDTVGIENMVEDSVSGICSVVTSDIAMEAASDTPVIADLIPNAVYNLYTMRSSTAEVPFSAENLLYIGQGTTSADGSLAIDYEPKEVDESAITFAVCMEQYDIMDAETNMHDLVYTGEEQIPLFDVTYHGSTLTEGVDYRVSGDISATDAGNYTITITGMGLYSGRKEVSYQILSSATKVAKITLNSSSTTLGVGKDITLKATITPTDAANQEVTWTSSDEKVATVDEDGKVTAVAAGTATITCTATDGSGVSATCKVTVTNYTPTEAFCARLYEKCLGRSADADGIDFWSKQLTNKTKSGAAVGYGFVFSDEYKKKKTSNEEYVSMLYEVFMDRKADATGTSYWVDLLEQGMSREYVFKGFAESQEYTNICKSYGIERGSITCKQARDQNVNLTKFVNRIYVKAMGRTGEESGLNYWCTQIRNKKMTPTQVAELFINSKEFTNKNLSDEEYIKVLYRTFMGREYDQAGLNYWLGQMKGGKTRQQVLKSFAGCPEFQNIIKGFGL